MAAPNSSFPQERDERPRRPVRKPLHDNEYLAEGLVQLEGANPQVPKPTFPQVRAAARCRIGWRHHGSPCAVPTPFTQREARGVAADRASNIGGAAARCAP